MGIDDLGCHGIRCSEDQAERKGGKAHVHGGPSGAMSFKLFGFQFVLSFDKQNL